MVCLTSGVFLMHCSKSLCSSRLSLTVLLSLNQLSLKMMNLNLLRKVDLPPNVINDLKSCSLVLPNLWSRIKYESNCWYWPSWWLCYSKVLIMLCYVPRFDCSSWFSMKQTSIQASIFGLKFILMKQCCKYVQGLWYKLKRCEYQSNYQHIYLVTTSLCLLIHLCLAQCWRKIPQVSLIILFEKE